MHNHQDVNKIGDALWTATAVVEPKTDMLAENCSCDVVVVGAGFTGLNAALQLAKAGLSVRVLEKNHVGFGASGRSGGQVNLGLNIGPSALLEKFGAEKGARFIELITHTPQRVFDFIRTEQLNCDPVQNGWVQGAITNAIANTQVSMVEDYAKHGFNFAFLDKESIAEKTGSDLYVAGIHCDVAGSIQPLSYTRELARVATTYGATIHSDSAVTGIDVHGAGWCVSTANGRIHSDKVLICTNGYTEPDSGKYTDPLHKTLVPIRSVLVATEPLSDNLRQTILPNEVTFVDKRKLILYMRYDRDGRLCVGDHGPMRDTFVKADFDDVKDRALRVFPQLKGVNWDFHWGGRIAMTKSTLPFLHEMAPGLIAGMGYNGRGVGMGTMMGQVMAEGLLKGSFENSEIPLTKPQPYFFHRFKDLGVNASIRWLTLMGYLEARK